LAPPEIATVGVPVNTLDDLACLFEGIPIEEINTSMTINATAMWLLALYVALAEQRGVDATRLQGTTQNDIIKEYLARGTYIFPPRESIRLIGDMYEYTLHHVPRWNASNICSYHLQEAGATPMQELAFALANAIAVLDAIRARGNVTHEEFERCVGRVSFFVNSGIRFVEEMCKLRAFGELWDGITRDRYGVQNPKYRLFRYGVQVNSLGLTEEQPENNAWRILIEALGVTLSRNVRCRALQLPTWNEALSLPRRWDEQWSLRLQQIVAYETDLLEYPDLFDGSPVVASKVAALKAAASAEIAKVDEIGGAIEAIESGYLKAELVRSQADRLARINSGDIVVVGRNRWAEGLPSPLLSGDDGGVSRADPESAAETVEMLRATRSRRSGTAVEAALSQLRDDAVAGKNLMPASIACARARVTTGEWAGVLREIFGEYRPATGVEGQQLRLETPRVAAVRARVSAWTEAHGTRPRMGVGKPGRAGAHGRRQAGARRPLQRLRDDRGRRQARGLRCRVRGHPHDPAGDRAIGGRGGRRRARLVGAVRLAPRDRPHGARRAPAPGSPRRDPRRARRHRPRRGRRAPPAARRQGGLHPARLRPDGGDGSDPRCHRPAPP